jgi:hypothetical protein
MDSFYLWTIPDLYGPVIVYPYWGFLKRFPLFSIVKIPVVTHLIVAPLYIRPITLYFIVLSCHPCPRHNVRTDHALGYIRLVVFASTLQSSIFL